MPIIHGVYTIYVSYGICCLGDPGGAGVTVGDPGASFVGIYMSIYMYISTYLCINIYLYY